MSKFKIAFLVMTLAVAGLCVSQASAMGLFVSNDNGDAVISADTTVDGSAYLAGKSVLVEGTVKGDLFCAGNDLIVNGTVEGDVLCAGQNVTLGGMVMGDVRLAGSNVTLKGTVQGSATVAGSVVNVSKGAVVGGDLTGGAATLIIDGTIGRDMLAGTDGTTIGGTIGRDVSASIGSLTFTSGAKIGGNLTYDSTAQSNVPAGVVAGETKFNKVQNNGAGSVNPFVAFLSLLASMIVLALLVTLVIPKYVHGAAAVSFKTVLIALLAGFASVVLVPMLAFVLIATVVGIPAGLLLLAAWMVYLALSGAFFSYYLGMTILKKRATNALLVAAVGALALGIVLAIPILNVLGFIAMIVVGTGLQVIHLQHQFGKKPYTIS
jgi:cytoskeletal protein CcmA (bactofilin family)